MTVSTELRERAREVKALMVFAQEDGPDVDDGTWSEMWDAYREVIRQVKAGAYTEDEAMTALEELQAWVEEECS